MQHDSQEQDMNQSSNEPILETQPGAEETAPAAAESLEAQVAELEARLAEMQAAVMYARAETDNARKRAQEDVAAAHKYAVGKFAGELLVVKDCLEMALLDNSSIENIKMGVEMTLRNLSGAFEKFQVKEVAPAAGDKLDPNKHQAMRAEESELEANTVVSVMQKGYVIADRVLRPAMVVVAK